MPEMMLGFSSQIDDSMVIPAEGGVYPLCLFVKVCSRSTRFQPFLLYLPLSRELLGHLCEKPPECIHNTHLMLVKSLRPQSDWLVVLLTSCAVHVLGDKNSKKCFQFIPRENERL